MRGKNEDIKQALAKNKIRQWQVARLLNVSESSLSRLMRDELSSEYKKRIFSAIEDLKSRGEV